MKELLEKGHPSYISPSNGRDKDRGFWPPFSSKRLPLPPGEHILAQMAKADKEKLPSNRVLQRIARLVQGHPLAMLEVSLAIGGGTYGIYTGIQSLKEVNVSNNPPSSIDIKSIGTNSFTDTRLVPRAEAETKKVNPEEIFDNAATRGVISERNIIEMDVEEYKKIAPPPVNKETPEQLNILFPIKLAEGSKNRVLHIKRSGDWMGGGIRTLNFRIDPDTQKPTNDGKMQVASSLTITDGIKEGDILVSPVSGMISGLTITGTDDAGNTYTILTYGIFTSSRSANFKLIKDIPLSKTEEFEPGKFRTIESHVPIQQGEVIGIITKPTKGPLGMAGAGGIGQFQMITLSTVKDENGKQQVGPTAIKINTSPDGKVYIPK